MAKKLIFLSGSTKQGSVNTTLAKAACDIAAAQGASAEFIDLNDYTLPLFDEDGESQNGTPDNARALKAKFVESDGFFFATPEYNSSYSPLVKNTIDWLSRPHSDDEPMLHAFMNKGAAIAAASPGALGGIRALVPMRLLLSNIGVNVVGNQLALGKAHEAFNDNGALKDERMNGMLNGIINSLIKIS